MRQELNKALLYKFIPNEGGSIWIVRISVVIQNLSLAQLAKYAEGKSEERRNQLACADWLIRNIHGSDARITRDTQGAPRIHGADGHISISHTGDFMAIYLHPKKSCAIDIELRGRNVDGVSKRFITDAEENLLKSLVDEYRLQIWSVKECLFKIIPVQKVLFREHLIIMSINHENGAWKQACSVKHPDLQQTYSVVSRIFEPLIVSYTVTDSDLI
jgi:4'-phosphopantetheinyl transferase EntD